MILAVTSRCCRDTMSKENIKVGAVFILFDILESESIRLYKKVFNTFLYTSISKISSYAKKSV